MRIPTVSLITLGISIMAACSSGPPSPRPGSPGFFWAVARESYRTGDLVKTDSTLLELTQGSSEYASKARAWHLVVAAGLGQAFSELADAYEAGAGMNLTSPLRFRNQSTLLRSMAASAALEFTQAIHETVECDKEGNVHLDFGYPTGTAASPDGLRKISMGIWPSDAERESLQTAMLQRGVILTVSRAVGSPDDPAKAQAVFQTPDVRVPHETFVFQMATLLYEESELFGPKRMDRPNRRATMCGEAREALQSLPQNDDTVELTKQINKTIKQLSGQP